MANVSVTMRFSPEWPDSSRNQGVPIRRLHVRVAPGVQRVRPLIHGGRSSVWLEHLVVVQEVAGSNPVGHPNAALLPRRGGTGI